MTPEAHLKRLHVLSPQPAELANFYRTTYGFTVKQHDDIYLCEAPRREIAFSEGPANQIKYSLFEFNSPEAWQAFHDRTRRLTQADLSAMIDLPAGAIGFRDPDGNLMTFAPPQPPCEQAKLELPSAILQHFALRTNNINNMLEFYANDLGFVLSDRVHDDTGTLKACFLRTEDLHHALALFGAPLNGFDHQSFETGDWNDLKTWADRMGSLRTVIVWGVGRHGPGDDVFFMVRDPDGNLAEISAEIEVCAPDRPVGTWPHEERTLNQWGKSIMRD